jgi:hypothetical protein
MVAVTFDEFPLNTQHTLFFAADRSANLIAPSAKTAFWLTKIAGFQDFGASVLVGKHSSKIQQTRFLCLSAHSQYLRYFGSNIFWKSTCTRLDVRPMTIGFGFRGGGVTSKERVFDRL